MGGAAGGRDGGTKRLIFFLEDNKLKKTPKKPQMNDMTTK